MILIFVQTVDIVDLLKSLELFQPIKEKNAITSWKMLSKSLPSLLKSGTVCLDEETRSKRYLDILMIKSLRNDRAKAVYSLLNYLIKRVLLKLRFNFRIDHGWG